MTDMRTRIAHIICVATAAISLAACKGGEAGKKADMGPEAVVEAFTRHIASGEFDNALELCDTSSMQEYVSECIREWDRLQKQDSSVLAIASSILSKADFKVEKTEKTDEGRQVYYSIETEGASKRKIAELRKEEGEWRVRTITDAI